MSNRLKIISSTPRLVEVMYMIDNGEIKIPSFQRGYVWNKGQKIDLFESIQLEYPIGTILLWKPEDKFKITNKLGPYTVRKINENKTYFILDGVQRLSTLFGALTNPNKTKHIIDNKIVKNFSIHYDLEKEEFNIPRTDIIEIGNIPIYVLIDTFLFLDYADNLEYQLKNKKKASELINRGRVLSSILIDYQIPFTEIYRGGMDEVVEIFWRLNSKGTPLSKDWMVSTLTNNETKNFNLGIIIGDLLKELHVFGFNDLKREVILQCIQSSFGKIYFDLSIEDLVKRTDFAEKTYKIIESIKTAIQFLYEELLILERKLLPNNNQLVFVTYFFNQIENPSDKQLKKLKNWFWVTTYSNYFTIYSLSKIRMAFEQFKDFIEGRNENPVFNDKPKIPFSIAEFPEKVFRGSVRYSALELFLLNYSNDFKKVDSKDIDSIDQHYLFFGQKTPQNLIPIVQYFEEEDNRFIKPAKYKDLQFLLTEEIYNPIFQKLFLTEDMIGKSQEEVLQLRKELIIKAERKFVEELDLIYEI